MEKRGRGFTLVELSIVLVIIGLLIGGILAAQSMISTAKIQATVRQIGQFDAAVNNFQTKYNQLPGDNDFFGEVVQGELHGDGKITDPHGIAAEFGGEIARFWYDLSLAGLAGEGGKRYQDVGSSFEYSPFGNYAPTVQMGDRAYVIPNYLSDPLLQNNVYLLGSYYSADPYCCYIGVNPAFKGEAALALDAKLDDGKPMTGKIVGLDNSDKGTITAGSLCSDGAAYAVATPGNICALGIVIGATSGYSR